MAVDGLLIRGAAFIRSASQQSGLEQERMRATSHCVLTQHRLQQKSRTHRFAITGSYRNNPREINFDHLGQGSLSQRGRTEGLCRLKPAGPLMTWRCGCERAFTGGAFL
ncbi:hypothetical protein DPEC_G00120870 [Dallia pectoralis]|uniref:Uncharacterized protein n=1 Tax=Dallia pectoralis TaxID=75939 RepID=A0ACC2GQJ2_DALPE|nr:hypothetical protein DPEC_G00120870 [Dallia pectoralis]